MLPEYQNMQVGLYNDRGGDPNFLCNSVFFFHISNRTNIKADMVKKKLTQSHFSLYLQNCPLKFCPEVHVPPPSKIVMGAGLSGSESQ